MQPFKNRKQIIAYVAGLLLLAFATPVLAADWWETVKIKGDFRYRHEYIKLENADQRNRQRIRMRLGVFADVSPYSEVGFQLASGASDPVSTNQSLTDGFSSKPVVIDLAYLELNHPQLPGWSILAGKFKNPFYLPGKSELFWDSDWRPEGGLVRLDKSFTGVDLYGVAGGLWIEERSKGLNSYALVVQGMARFHINKVTSIAGGGSYLNYDNTKGFPPFYDPEDAGGNTTVPKEISTPSGPDTIMVYGAGFQVVEVFAELSTVIAGFPVTVMGDVATNTAADSLNFGWLAGLRVGKASKGGAWEIRYNYREVENDAVIGRFTDSDFRGGGTDAKGHEIGGAIGLAKNTVFAATYFLNEIGYRDPGPTTFKRLQVDLQLKF